MCNKKESKKYLIKCKYNVNSEDEKIIFPFMGSLNSLNGVKPVETVNKLSRTFMYSNQCNMMGYIADGYMLSYNVFDEGYIDFYVNSNNGFILNIEERYICTICNDNISIALYLDSSGSMVLKINNNCYYTGIFITADDFTTRIKLSWIYENNSYIFSVQGNGVTYNETYSFSQQSNLMLYLGGKYVPNLEVLEQPFYGLISNLIISNNNESVIMDVDETVSEFNGFGICEHSTVLKNYEKIVDNSYELERNETNHNIINGNIKSQIINFNNSNQLEFAYTYNNGNIVSITKDENQSSYRNYTYNGNNELKSEQIFDLIDDEIIDFTVNYNYDSYGNITSRTVNNNSYDFQSETIFEYNNTLSPYLLTKVNDKEVYYDSYGNIEKYGIFRSGIIAEGITCSYEMGLLNKVIIKNDSYKTVKFLYDSSGNRISKTIETQGSSNIIEHKYSYIGNKLIYEIISSTSDGIIRKIEYMYDSNGMLYGFNCNNENYYYVRDLTGCIIKIINEEKVIVHEYCYDAYGNIINQYGSLSNINSIIYKGYYYDAETNLFLVSSRYYSPELCRWISPDDIEYLDPESVNGLNLYCYCGNDPVNRYDVNGNFWDYVLDAVFIVAGLYDFIKDPSWSKAGWLALDIGLAVLPFIPAISSARHLGKVDNVIDAASTLNKIDNVGDVASGFRYADDVIDSGQEIGTYLLKNVDGDVIYVGKGSRNRMMQNFKRFDANSFLYYPAKNADIALANEAYFMSIYGGARSMNSGTRLFNKINSPGLRRLFWWF